MVANRLIPRQTTTNLQATSNGFEKVKSKGNFLEMLPIYRARVEFTGHIRQNNGSKQEFCSLRIENYA